MNFSASLLTLCLLFFGKRHSRALHVEGDGIDKHGFLIPAVDVTRAKLELPAQLRNGSSSLLSRHACSTTGPVSFDAFVSSHSIGECGDAYVVLAAGSPGHASSVLALVASLLLTNANYPLVVVSDGKAGDDAMNALHGFGCMVLVYSDAINATAVFPRWQHALNKIRIWQLTAFNKLTYLDLDMLVLQNVDDLMYALPNNTLRGQSDILFPSCGSRSRLCSGYLSFTPDRRFYEDLLVTISSTVTHDQAAIEQVVASSSSPASSSNIKVYTLEFMGPHIVAFATVWCTCRKLDRAGQEYPRMVHLVNGPVGFSSDTFHRGGFGHVQNGCEREFLRMFHDRYVVGYHLLVRLADR